MVEPLLGLKTHFSVSADVREIISFPVLGSNFFSFTGWPWTTGAELEAQWKNEGATFEPVKREWLSSHEIYQLQPEGSPAALESFAEGKFYVQDPSTLASVYELNPQPGENILDLCAAPGGKRGGRSGLINMGNKAHCPAGHRA